MATLPHDLSGRRPRLVVCTLAVAALMTLVVAPARAQIYEWTDADGVTHLTTDRDRIPAPHRDGARVIDSSPRDPAAPLPADPGTLVYNAGAPVIAEALLNGVPLRLIVDTGASRTIIAPPALARAGFAPGSGRPVRIAGVTGGAVAEEISVPRFDVGGAQIGPLAVIAHDIALPGVDGLLGRDVLDQFVLTIDAARGRATLGH